MSGPPDDALARLRYVVAFAWDNGLGWESKQEADAALDELQRLREERDALLREKDKRPRMSNEMELLLQASRTSPVLHEAAVAVETDLRGLRESLVAMVYVHPCGCGDGIPAGQCARCRAVETLGFDPAKEGA